MKGTMTEKDKQREFIYLLEPVRSGLSRYAMALCNNREDAHDLVSDTVLAAYESYEKIRNKGAFTAYLFSVARKIFHKKLRRKKFFAIFNEEDASNIRSKDANPEVSTDISYLYESLAKLPDSQREALILFEISGFSIEEISKIQKVGISGVKSRLKRGRERLEKIMNYENVAVPLNGNGQNHTKIIITDSELNRIENE